MKKLDHPQQVAERVKKSDKEIRDAVLKEATQVFGKDALFINDCIKQVMQEHVLDYRNENLQGAFIRVAIAAKKIQYPTKIKQHEHRE